MIARPFILAILLITYHFPLFSQIDQIDSLKKIVSTERNDTFKVNNLLNLSKKLFSTSPDEAIVYASQARDISAKLNYRKGEATAYKNIGIGHYWQGEYVDAIHNYEKAMALFDSLGDKVGIANIQSNIGAIYFNQSDDERALEYYLQSLKTSEEVGDTLRIITACVNIGVVYANKPKTYDKALEYYRRALPL